MWEDIEKWFINYADGNKAGPTEYSRWQTDRQLEATISFYMGFGKLFLYKVDKSTDVEQFDDY